MTEGRTSEGRTAAGRTAEGRTAEGRTAEGRTDRELLAALLGPGRPEVSCDACFELLDRYVDLELAGADADARVPGMRAHLEGCPACREDHDALRRLAADAT